MRCVNKAILIGRLGQDPEVRTLPSGTSFTNLRLATSKVSADKESGESKEYTQWHNLTCWGKQSEFASKYLKKGNLVYVEGEIRYREWEGTDGKKGRSTEISVFEIVQLTPQDKNTETEEDSQEYVHPDHKGKSSQGRTTHLPQSAPKKLPSRDPGDDEEEGIPF